MFKMQLMIDINYPYIYYRNFTTFFIQPMQIAQLRSENQKLLEQNHTLKQSLEELIAVNTELTESIQQFSNNNTLNERIRELENQNKSLKNQLNNSIRKLESNEAASRQDLEVENEQLTEIIKDLVEKSNQSQIVYQEEINKLSAQLANQKRHFEGEIRKLQQKHQEKVQQYEETILQLKKKNESINVSIQQKVLKQSQQLREEQRKNLKVSTTIEDLRNVLTSQIEQKDKIIGIYQNLIEKLKQKIKQKY